MLVHPVPLCYNYVFELACMQCPLIINFIIKANLQAHYYFLWIYKEHLGSSIIFFSKGEGGRFKGYLLCLPWGGGGVQGLLLAKLYNVNFKIFQEGSRPPLPCPPLDRSTHVFLGYFAFLRQAFQVLIQLLYLNLKKERFEVVI